MKPILLMLSLFIFGLAAQAEPRVYELAVPAVQCSYSSEKAEQAARRAHPGVWAKADPRAHKIVVRFEDEQTSLDAVVASLGGSGYEVARRKQLR